MVYGDFSNIAGVYLALAEWLQNHPQYRMNGSTTTNFADIIKGVKCLQLNN
jgi:hypothetical protein